MGGADNLYSQFVSWSKILLPLAGIALLSTMFLFARNRAPDPTIPYAEIEEIARDARISDPRFSGVAADGSSIAITAHDIRPDAEQPDAFYVTEIRADIAAVDGSAILITAGAGRLDSRAQMAQMTGLARLTSSSGYVMETDGLLANLETGEITSLGSLEVHAPFGELTAGGLEVSLSPDGTGQRMVFKDGVRLLYTPQPE